MRWQQTPRWNGDGLDTSEEAGWGFFFFFFNLLFRQVKNTKSEIHRPGSAAVGVSTAIRAPARTCAA